MSELEELETETSEAEVEVTEPIEGQTETETEARPADGDTSTSETEPIEGQTGEEEAKDTGENLYTPEEMRTLDPENVDTSRIPPEMQPFYKSMQAGADRRINKELTAIRETAPEAAKPKAPPGTIEEAYDIDPEGTLAFLNRERTRKSEEGDIAGAQEILDVKSNLLFRSQNRLSEQNRLSAMGAEVSKDIRTAIPDFDQKSPELEKFAVGHGITREAMAFFTNPAIVGPLAGVMTKGLHSMYVAANAGKTVDGKLVKDAPKVAKPGTKPASTAGKANVAALYKKAQDTGADEDWTRYFVAKGEQ